MGCNCDCDFVTCLLLIMHWSLSILPAKPALLLVSFLRFHLSALLLMPQFNSVLFENAEVQICGYRLLFAHNFVFTHPGCLFIDIVIRVLPEHSLWHSFCDDSVLFSVHSPVIFSTTLSLNVSQRSLVICVATFVLCVLVLSFTLCMFLSSPLFLVVRAVSVSACNLLCQHTSHVVHPLRCFSSYHSHLLFVLCPFQITLKVLLVMSPSHLFALMSLFMCWLCDVLMPQFHFRCRFLFIFDSWKPKFVMPQFLCS